MAETYIEPGNIVGYTKVNLAANGFTMIGTCFEGCGVDKPIKIKDLVGEFFGGEGYSSADCLTVWDRNTGNYRTYPYFFGDWGVGEEAYNNKWYRSDNDSVETEDILEPGDAFWINRRAGMTTVTIAGQVPTNDVLIQLSKGFTMIANPFPVDIKIKSLSGNFYGGEGYSSADCITVWDQGTGNYRTYPYFFGDWGIGEEAYNDKWYRSDNDSVETEDVIAPGEAFWIEHRGTGCTLTILAPSID